MGFPDSEINSILTIQKGSQNVRWVIYARFG
jgi:hypothetical protein